MCDLKLASFFIHFLVLQVCEPRDTRCNNRSNLNLGKALQDEDGFNSVGNRFGSRRANIDFGAAVKDFLLNYDGKLWRDRTKRAVLRQPKPMSLSHTKIGCLWLYLCL